MVDFVSYQIRELEKWIGSCVFSEYKLDFEFVLYCKKYISVRGKLPEYLYQHLNNLFWTYHD